MQFDIVQWLWNNKSIKFSSEEEAFMFLKKYGEQSGIFNELCIDGVYFLENSYDLSVLNIIGINYAKKHLLLLFNNKDVGFCAAMVNPFDVAAIDHLHLKYGKNISIFLAKKKDIEKALKLKPENIDEELSSISVVQDKFENKTGIDSLFTHILKEALDLRVSDLHFENNIHGMRIRGRIDGDLITLREIDLHLARAMIVNIKLSAKLKIDDTRFPQDGRIKILLNDRNYDIRVSLIPTIYGENIVLRIFNNSETDFSLETIGLDDRCLRCLKSLSEFENGLIVVAGSTGSGKTTTLYSLLKNLSSPQKKIVTVEDPIEYQLEHVNQVAVNEEIGLTFSKIIRFLLRQSPNVIFIGEIRDTNTAQVTIQAALTGHLVLSSIHAGSAEEAITRLKDLGVSNYLVNSCLRAVIFQQLVKLKCEICHNNSKEKVLCKQCLGRGYFGRTGIFEILLNKDISENLLESCFEDFGFFCKLQDSISALSKQDVLFSFNEISSKESIF